jgi:peroxiredoxin
MLYVIFIAGQKLEVFSMAVLKAGAQAPDFTLTDQSGQEIRLRDFKGRKVLLYFFPKAGTSG